ncbi:hypothetical protein P3T39_004499 [Kitasatospora sp. GP82]|nr:hypothetical protein [Kitasatospora sp. GP82]
MTTLGPRHGESGDAPSQGQYLGNYVTADAGNYVTADAGNYVIVHRSVVSAVPAALLDRIQ